MATDKYNNNPYRDALSSAWPDTSDMNDRLFRQGTEWKNRTMEMYMAGLDYQAQLDLMNFQNEYNSPAAMAARMRQAGLNPDLLGVDGVSQAASGPSNFEAGSKMSREPNPLDKAALVTSLVSQGLQAASGVASQVMQLRSQSLDLSMKNLDYNNRLRHDPNTIQAYGQTMSSYGRPYTLPDGTIGMDVYPTSTYRDDFVSRVSGSMSKRQARKAFKVLDLNRQQSQKVAQTIENDIDTANISSVLNRADANARLHGVPSDGNNFDPAQTYENFVRDIYQGVNEVKAKMQAYEKKLYDNKYKYESTRDYTLMGNTDNDANTYQRSLYRTQTLQQKWLSTYNEMLANLAKNHPEYAIFLQAMQSVSGFAGGFISPIKLQ